jgi:hypothetical protein
VISSIVSRIDAVLVEVLRGSAAFLSRALAVRLTPPMRSPVFGRLRLLATAGSAPADRSEIDDVTHASVPLLVRLRGRRKNGTRLTRRHFMRHTRTRRYLAAAPVPN